MDFAFHTQIGFDTSESKIFLQIDYSPGVRFKKMKPRNSFIGSEPWPQL